MEIWDLDYRNYRDRTIEARQYCNKHGYDKGTHEIYNVGDVVYFKTGLNDDIPAKASIKGIKGNDLYVFCDCYWCPLESSRVIKIERCNNDHT